ncbi:Cysteine protease, C1A family [Persephonella hydrogeniphila]|uniref:Cysteine protease, C1A family n=1 Tax=Persephonella hydrogeniphila TaxID=198703 RepID=A0A285NLH5_9AQUI|nr:C1 family peptidase [Persephonella hydrogeniphila]SNZ10384.1 Cysteine protease, C1A family [Persephonella hydrogeniphila]
MENLKVGIDIGLGWLPDLPDFRDYTEENENVKPALKKLGIEPKKFPKFTIPSKIDLRGWCSPVENQGSLGSCTAHAGVGLIEYFERRAYGKHIDASRLFLYKTTRNLLHWTGDTGAFLRTTMGAMVLFGVPPEEYWPYTTAKPDFDREPPAFCYSFAQNYQAIKYFRLDPPGTDLNLLLRKIKILLSFGWPSMFGFTVYSSISQARYSGEIPFPCPRERILGGHAVMAVGYDDNKKIKNTNCGVETKGAFLIRNSWGTGWGDNGYGWLPYDFVMRRIARDWWTLIKNEWIDTGKFGL